MSRPIWSAFFVVEGCLIWRFLCCTCPRNSHIRQVNCGFSDFVRLKNTHIIQIPFFLAHTFGTPRLELAEGWKERKISQKNVIWHSLSVKMADQKRLLSVFLRQKWNFYCELRFGIAFDCSYSVCHDKRAVAEKKISNNK